MLLILLVRGKYPQVNSELLILQKEGIIIDKRSGRTRIISLNREKPNTDILLEALKLLHGKRK